MKKCIWIVWIVSVLGIQKGYSQAYKTGVGLRISPLYGITIKHMNNAKIGWEGIVSGRWNGVQVTGLYEVHTPAFKQERLLAFAGIGGHVALWRDGRYNPWYNADFFDWGRLDYNFYAKNRDPDRGRAVVGMDMIIGLEYTIKELPLSFSLDWKPLLNIIGGGSMFVEDVGFSVRFVFP